MTEGGRSSSSRDPRSRLSTPVGAVVTLIWAISAVVGLRTGNFQGLEVVSPVMVIFCGYVFGINIVRTERASTKPDRER